MIDHAFNITDLSKQLLNILPSACKDVVIKTFAKLPAEKGRKFFKALLLVPHVPLLPIILYPGKF